jgi:hypothetical protein
MILLLISLLLGMVLGQRFRVLVLLPAMGIILSVAIGMGLASALGLRPTALLAVGSVVSLQIGYLAGIGLRYFLAGARGAKPSTLDVGTQPAVRRVQSSAS